MSETLKPCPFCGCDALVTKSTQMDWYGHWLATCNCDGEGCAVAPYVYGSREDEGRAEAIALWNRRATDARDEAAGQMLRALSDARQELWVDYCLSKGRTDCDPAPFSARPVVRLLDTAIDAARAAGLGESEAAT